MANWLNFRKMQDWGYLFFQGFQYDEVSDELIASSLSDTLNLAQVRPDIDWQCDSWLARNEAIPVEHKHAYRVAALANAFRSGDLMTTGITLDTFDVRQCRSCVSDGHHRVRTLQFLGLSAGPFWLGGHVEPLRDLVRLAGTAPPESAVRYCSVELLMSHPDDIRLDW